MEGMKMGRVLFVCLVVLSSAQAQQRGFQFGQALYACSHPAPTSLKLTQGLSPESHKSKNACHGVEKAVGEFDRINDEIEAYVVRLKKIDIATAQAEAKLKSIKKSLDASSKGAFDSANITMANAAREANAVADGAERSVKALRDLGLRLGEGSYNKLNASSCEAVAEEAKNNGNKTNVDSSCMDTCMGNLAAQRSAVVICTNSTEPAISIIRKEALAVGSTGGAANSGVDAIDQVSANPNDQPDIKPGSGSSRPAAGDTAATKPTESKTDPLDGSSGGGGGYSSPYSNRSYDPYSSQAQQQPQQQQQPQAQQQQGGGDQGQGGQGNQGNSGGGHGSGSGDSGSGSGLGQNSTDKSDPFAGIVDQSGLKNVQPTTPVVTTKPITSEEAKRRREEANAKLQEIEAAKNTKGIGKKKVTPTKTTTTTGTSNSGTSSSDGTTGASR